MKSWIRNGMRRFSLRAQVVILMMAIGIVSSLLLSYLAYLHDVRGLESRVETMSRSQAALIKNLSLDALIAEDRPTLQTIVDGIQGIDLGLSQMIINNYDGDTLASWTCEEGKPKDVFETLTPIEYFGQNFGKLYLAWNSEKIIAPMKERAFGVAKLMVGSIVGIGLCLILFVEFYFIRPLSYLERKVDSFLDGTELHQEKQEFCSLELTRLDASLDEAIRAVRGREERENEIREQKAKVRVAEEAAAARTEFLSLMSHEIRTPLGAMLGFAELLDTPELEGEQRECVTHIRESGSFLLRILNDILDLAKIEANGIQLNEEPVSIDKLIGEIGSMMSDQASRKGLDLEVKSNLSSETLVVGDAHRLKQVIMNLAGNAVKFTKEGSVSIEAFASSPGICEGGDMEITFSIRDTGIGMSEEQSASIFTPFSQADASITRQFGGTGLGVSISSELVALMGGELTVESELEKGSLFSFKIELPVAQAAKTRREPTEKVSDKTALEESQPLSLLIAEDDPVNQRLISAILGRMGHDFVFANDGLECLELLSGDTVFDAVLLDLRMPVMGGMEVLRSIRTGDCGAGRTAMPVSMMSADVLSLEEAKREGADDFIMKPISLEHLERFLASCHKEQEVAVSPPVASIPGFSLPLKSVVTNADSRRIMVADDNPAVRDLMGKFLNKWGYQTGFAEDGVDCLRQLSLQQYDAIVSDLRMPKMDGKTLISHIRGGDAGESYRKVAVALMTAESITEEEALEAHADAFIPKPIPLQSLRTFLDAMPESEIGLVG